MTLFSELLNLRRKLYIYIFSEQLAKRHNVQTYTHLFHKYGIGLHVWYLPLCKLYKCFYLFLLNHHKTIANGVFIRDLCLLRENNIVDDDQDLTSTELTYMIEFLCTS